MYVLGGVSPALFDNATQAIAATRPFVAKLSAGSMTEVWRRDLLDAPLAWRWVACRRCRLFRALMAVMWASWPQALALQG